MRHVAPIPPPFSAHCAYFPAFVPRRSRLCASCLCGLLPGGRQLAASFTPPALVPRSSLPLCLCGKSRRFSILRPLVLSCLSFSHSYPLFSAACRLFFQNRGGGGQSWLTTFSADDQPAS